MGIGSSGGNIPFRADFPNPDRLLRHGQTGNVLIHRTLKNALVILITGIFLVLEIDAYGFGTRFVTVGFAMIVIGAVLGVVVFERSSNEAAEAIEAGDEGRIKATVSRIAGFGALDTVLLLLTIAAMVTRWS